ncbi:MAG: RNA-directed DNA polymerase [Alphaproteobacteria bacterium]|nr:RNA-directed DNA polymerase [Alphaproteobacteria bacterium]
MKTVLDLDANAAKKFFLTNENYFTGDLPPYFQFNDIIKETENILQNNKFLQIYDRKPQDVSNINYEIIINKNGEYDWRKLTIINPVLYVNLVNCICSVDAWEKICDRFKEFKADDHIVCSSIPVVKGIRKRQKAQQISNWLTEFEQDSVKQSLVFSHMVCTDIVNCYSSIYTHSIAWALHGEEIAKNNKHDMSFLGNVIDSCVRDLSYNQTNGIPQGSVLMDFIAEIVLGYIDTLILKKLKQQHIEEYKILRYRDDYRIFTNNPKDSETILKIINDICQHMGLRLNIQKTFATDKIISKAVKKDRFEFPINFAQPNYKLFLQLYKMSEDQQNAGALQSLLSILNQKIKLTKKDKLELLISVMTDIAYNVPKVIPQAFTTISHILRKEPREVQLEHIAKIRYKFSKKAYTSFVHIWLQRLSVNIDNGIEYEPDICKKIKDETVELWNFGWLKKEFLDRLKACGIVNTYKLRHAKLPIESKETNIFEYN